MANELVLQESGSYLQQWREPEDVLAEATKAAVALKKVVSMKKSPVMFNGEQYLEREDWGTVAKFYGCTAKTVETRYVEFGNERGFEAVAVVIDRNMNEVGRAESMCLSGELNWGEVPVYEWQDILDDKGKKIWDASLRNGKGGYKAKKVQTGTSPKPLFQLRSMAATRAEAKALKGVFSWVVVLAGYQPTPAEEMTGNEQFYEQEEKQQKPPIQQPQRASEKAAQQTSSKEGDTKTQTTSGSTTGGSVAGTSQPSGEVVSGIIEDVKQAKSGILWLTVKGIKNIVRVLEKDVDSGMVKGNFIKFRGQSANNAQIGDFVMLLALIELSPVEDGTVPSTAPLTEDAEKAATEMFGEKPQGGQAAVAEMVKNGDLKPASAVPSKKPGTIGPGKRKRLLALCNTNKKTNNGFDYDQIKKILAAFPNPVEHIQDMEEGMLSQFEKWATGEEDFNDFWKD